MLLDSTKIKNTHQLNSEILPAPLLNADRYLIALTGSIVPGSHVVSRVHTVSLYVVPQIVPRLIFLRVHRYHNMMHCLGHRILTFQVHPGWEMHQTFLQRDVYKTATYKISYI